MTCVIGYRDPKNGRVYIGTDSCGGNLALGRQFTRKDRKVFKLRDDEDTLIGFCGSFFGSKKTFRYDLKSFFVAVFGRKKRKLFWRDSIFCGNNKFGKILIVNWTY